MGEAEKVREYRLRIYNRAEEFFPKKITVRITDDHKSSRKWHLRNFDTFDRCYENTMDTFEVRQLFLLRIVALF